MNIAAYCRVSTDSKDQLNSYENQHSYFEREIQKRGNNLFHIYADRGLTGTVLNNRPEFEQMLIDAGIDIKVFTENARDRRRKKRHTVYEISDRHPLFNEIWIKNTSRFARNTLSYEIITKLRSKGVNIYFIEQNINTLDVAQDLLLKLMQIFDEQDSKDKSSKVRMGHQEGALKNVVRTNGKIFGYQYIQHENRLVIIPEEAEIIRLIFDLYSQGYGTRRLMNEIRRRGLKTRNGKEFGKTTLRRILDNEKYAGINNPLKYDTGIVLQEKISPRVKAEYLTMDSDRIEPIVTKEMFEKCKKIKDSSLGHSYVGIYKGVSKYASLLYCEKCGSVFYCNNDDGRVFYNCKRKRLYGTTECDAPNVYQKQIDAMIATLSNGGLTAIVEQNKVLALNRHIGRMQTLLNSIDKTAESLCSEIIAEIEETKRRLDSFYELFAVSRSNKEAIMSKVQATEQTLEKLNERLSDYSSGNGTILSDIKTLHKKIQGILDFGDLQRNYSEKEVISLLDKIIVGRENGKATLIPYFKATSDLMTLLSENQESIKDYEFTEEERDAIIRRSESLL